MRKFIIDGQYRQLLATNRVDAAAVLQAAKLPADTFAHENICLTEEEYFRMLNAIAAVDSRPDLPIKLAASDKIETFSAPLLAAFCSENSLKCLYRIRQYKKLIGPWAYQIREEKENVTVTLATLSGYQLDSPFLVESEIIFLINFLSKARGQKINPQAVNVTYHEQNTAVLQYVGTPFKLGTANQIIFSKKDLLKPFKSANRSVLSYFEPELEKRLAELDVDDSYATRVRSALAEILPQGEATIDDVARRLGLSKRTLQRRLKNEQTNFQQQLNSTREMFAKNYLINTQMSADEIAFLLAYQETNSFIRAFSIWTGQGVNEYRQNYAKQ